MKTTMNPELVVEDIREMIRDYDTKYWRRPKVLVIGDIYLHFLRAWEYKIGRFTTGELETFEGLTIIKTRKDVCDVF